MSSADAHDPSRVVLIRETWSILNGAKDLGEARVKFKDYVTALVLGQQ